MLSERTIGIIVLIVFLVLVLLVVASCIKIVPQAKAFVVEQLGAYKVTWGTGLHFKLPFVERVAKQVNLKEQVVDFPPQPVITKDNVTMRIDTVVFFQITDPRLFSYGVESPIMGSQPSLIQKSIINSMARKNAGMEVMVSETARVTLSVTEYCLMADRMPMGRPISTATMMLKVASFKV